MCPTTSLVWYGMVWYGMVWYGINMLVLINISSSNEGVGITLGTNCIANFNGLRVRKLGNHISLDSRVDMLRIWVVYWPTLLVGRKTLMLSASSLFLTSSYLKQPLYTIGWVYLNCFHVCFWITRSNYWK